MFFAATPAPQQQELDGFALFFSQYGLLILLLLVLVFMFWSSRRRMQRMKTEQETKAKAMLPGAKVLLQGGLYGTLVEFDADDLSKAARVEIAPGVDIEVHSQAILRVVEDEVLTEDDFIEAEEENAEYEEALLDGEISPVTDDHVTDVTPDSTADSDDKPKS